MLQSLIEVEDGLKPISQALEGLLSSSAAEIKQLSVLVGRHETVLVTVYHL